MHGRGIHPRAGGNRACARLHACLDGAVRAVAVGAGAGASARDRAAAQLGAAEHLRLRLLGAPDDRRAGARHSPPPRAGSCRSTWTSCTVREPWTPAAPASSVGAGWLAWIALLKAYERHPLASAAQAGPGTRRALDRAPPGGRRLLGRYPAAMGVFADGAAPAGYPLDHPVMRRGIEGIDALHGRGPRRAVGVGAPAGPSRRLEACQSPVWDTALALVALADAGLPADHPALVRAGDWLLGGGGERQRRLGGRRAGLAAGRLGV